MKHGMSLKSNLGNNKMKSWCILPTLDERWKHAKQNPGGASGKRICLPMKDTQEMRVQLNKDPGKGKKPF